MEIRLMKKIMGSNSEIAEENRKRFAERQVAVVNVMASPGAGKTSTILGLLAALRGVTNTAVIEGDIASSIDAEKIDAIGVPVVQINTGGGCHLDANVIREAADDLQTRDGLLFIENVGNLICPSSFDLGETLRMVIASVPEGHDKPYKYLAMFESADVVVLNKVDLIDYIDFDKDAFYRGVAAINTKHAPIIEVSCRTKSGLQELADHILQACRTR
ncbi:MAG TPA: hydrogenase nickel incorporation protein HypB [Armatimonadota bacterium]|nr:hydrogenase nickel incorporation protein HypB [Armatimonadota bacterium]